MALRCVLIAISLFLIVPGFAQRNKKKSKEDMELFRVNGESVSVNEFIYLYKKNNQLERAEQGDQPVLDYLELFIIFKLKVAEAKRRGMDTVSSFVNEFEGYRAELLKPYLPEEKIVDSLVQLTYKRLQEEVRASHILIKLPQNPTPTDTLEAYHTLAAIRERAVQGEDFSELAAQYTYPQERATKGDLGYFTALQMVYPFENAAYTTPVGQISDIFRTQFGYHIVKVTDRQPTRGEVEVSHIMIRHQSGTEEDVKNKVFEIYDQLRNGGTWDDVCKANSEDLSSKDKGGRLRPFGVGAMRQAPEFENVAFAMKQPGDISDPFKTAYGWHIIRLERKGTIPSLEDMDQQLRRSVTRDERLTISKQEWQDKYKRQYGFEEAVITKGEILKLADSSITQGKWNPQVGAEFGKAALIKFAGKTYSVSDFLSFAQKNQRPGLEPEAGFNHLYVEYVESLLLDRLEQHVSTENTDFRMLLREYYEGILLFEIMEQEVWDKATQDTVGQRAFFASHQSQYKAGDRVRASIYHHGDQQIMERLRSILQTQDSAQIEEFVQANGVRVESGRFEKEDRAVFGAGAWSPGIYESENNGVYYIAEISEVIPPGLKTFEEARASIISDYQEELEKKWVAQLKDTYKVSLNDKGKKYVLKVLGG